MTFHTRPQDEGQIVCISYAHDVDSGLVIRRIYDRSDQSIQEPSVSEDSLIHWRDGEFDEFIINGGHGLDAAFEEYE